MTVASHPPVSLIATNMETEWSKSIVKCPLNPSNRSQIPSRWILIFCRKKIWMCFGILLEGIDTHIFRKTFFSINP